MRSIGARLALFYGAAATVTISVLLGVGYYLLQSHLVNGLDLLNSAEFEQVKAHLGTDYATQSPAVIDRRIRETTEFASVLFFISIDDPGQKAGTIFYSTNLKGRPIPDVPGKRRFNAELKGVGDLRVGEFILDRFDVTIATPLEPVREVMEGYRRVCLLLVALMIAISGVSGLVLSRIALRPLRLIRETASRISSDNLSERIPVAAVDDELSDLARLLNAMFDRLEISFDQIRRFTADASHELKTPLSLVRLQGEKLLVQGRLSAEDEETVLSQLEEVGRLNQIIEELLFLSRAEADGIRLSIEPSDPLDLLRGFASDARVLAEHLGRRFELVHEGNGLALYDPRWLRRILLNLLTNALEASPPGGLVLLRSDLSDAWWQLSVSDQGGGVAPENLERIFHRFVRLADSEGDSSRGSGLGLAICRSITRLHRGRIWAEPGPDGVGLRVVVEIPATRDPGPAPGPTARSPEKTPSRVST